MNTAEVFEIHTKEWDKHCQSVLFSSNMKDYLDHPAYQKLVQLGYPAIPFIIARYKIDNLPWGFVLQAITGIEIIANPDAFSPAQVKASWIKWWEDKAVTHSPQAERRILNHG